MSVSRLIREFEALGVPVKAVEGGSIIFFENPDFTFRVMVEDAHVPDDVVENPYEEDPLITYLSTDLEARASNIMDQVGSGSAEWLAYLKLQTDLIKTRRREAYAHPETGSDGLRDQYLAGECTKEEWLITRSGIKNSYAWPGGYR